MIPVSSILGRARKIVNSCDDETLFEYLSDAVELLANKGDFDPLMGVIDITAQGRVVTLPRDAETIMGVNISGVPSMGRNVLFNFHLNGPGDKALRSCAWRWWKDGGQSPVFRDLEQPARLIAVCDEADDSGTEVWVEGVTPAGVVIRTKISGTWNTGQRLVAKNTVTLPAANAPVFGRITRVRTSVRSGAVRLYAQNESDAVHTLIGLYQWDEVEPRLRRLELDAPACWVRIAFRRRVFEIRHATDLIPLHSKLAVLEALRAVALLDEDDVALSAAHEATALRLITEKESSLASPTNMAVQIDPSVLLNDKLDQVD